MISILQETHIDSETRKPLGQLPSLKSLSMYTDTTVDDLVTAKRDCDTIACITTGLHHLTIVVIDSVNLRPILSMKAPNMASACLSVYHGWATNGFDLAPLVTWSSLQELQLDMYKMDAKTPPILPAVSSLRYLKIYSHQHPNITDAEQLSISTSLAAVAVSFPLLIHANPHVQVIGNGGIGDDTFSVTAEFWV
jgi:hypothetical protein